MYKRPTNPLQTTSPCGWRSHLFVQMCISSKFHIQYGHTMNECIALIRLNPLWVSSIDRPEHLAAFIALETVKWGGVRSIIIVGDGDWYSMPKDIDEKLGHAIQGGIGLNGVSLILRSDTLKLVIFEGCIFHKFEFCEMNKIGPQSC